MTPELSTLLVLVAGGLVLLAGGVYWWINRTPHVERRENEPLPLFGSTSPDERLSSPEVSPAPAPAPKPTPKPTPQPAPQPAPQVVPRPVAAPVAPSAAEPEPRRSGPVIREFVTRGTPPSSPAVSSTPPAASPPRASEPAPVPGPSTVVSAAGVPGTMVEGHALRFSVPAEGTLQFLPGRLEIGSGLDTGREIRFVRVEGPNGIEVTFGRSEGELYRHVQLRDKTVSRAHAVMRFTDSVWYLQNLSLTNPVVYNGAQMPAAVVQPLGDGDRIEMGEVVFTFRSR